jgi:hypothetical protein
VNKADWATLSDERLEDAKALLGASRWAAGYHLTGYAVECAFKACILNFVANQPDIIFTNKRFSEKTWTHDPTELVKLADLDMQLDHDMQANPITARNWAVVKLWTVESRYQRKNQIEAEELFAAVADQPDGVMQWIKAHW